MEFPQVDGSDATAVLTAALGVLFQTHPDRQTLLRAWEPIAAAMPLIAIQNGSKDVSHNANVVIAQALLHVARTGSGPTKAGPNPHDD
ncbi:hypothetical protein [Burkholderia gladioli]|uniref:Uncharacterized protein n=1 Tax=Burkholderia gladioli TaxID=28095 RepID=A0AB38TKV9_BURGA|nr:hypothetical protein [Burkholderia gladioli]UWX68846.1 hypothetical protein NYZ96_11415 [Burkholderia gladioli]